MRALLLLSLFCSGALLRAQGTVSSVTAGAWTSAGTWDCACVPQTGDTIVVQHSVGLPSNVVHLGGAIRITATGALVGSGPSGLWSNAPFTNAGQVSVHRLVLPEGNAWTDSLLNSGTIATTRMAVRRRGRNTGVITAIDSLVFDHCSFHNEATISSRVTWVRDSLLWNNGLFISYELIVDSTGLFHNVGTCRVLDHLAVRSSGNFNVATGAVETHVLGDADIRWGLNVWDAHLQVDGRLHLNDVEVPIPHLTFFVQGGSIHTGHFRNQGWVAGPGTLCIADSAENLGILHPVPHHLRCHTHLVHLAIPRPEHRHRGPRCAGVPNGQLHGRRNGSAWPAGHPPCAGRWPMDRDRAARGACGGGAHRCGRPPDAVHADRCRTHA